MATLAQKIEAETRMRNLLEENGLPQPDFVEYGYTCIRLIFTETKHVIVIDIDEPEDGDVPVEDGDEPEDGDVAAEDGDVAVEGEDMRVEDEDMTVEDDELWWNQNFYGSGGERPWWSSET